MPRQPVIVIFDVGKTNKKMVLFDGDYQVVFENNVRLDEIADEDGFACEDVGALKDWIKKSFHSILEKKEWDVRAVNFSGYGASFVFLDQKSQVFLPLYNYLKPYPTALQQQFDQLYGADNVHLQTASPILGSLNSGMQLYRLKNENLAAFAKIKWALHLPQFLSWTLSSIACSETTSIGCHTLLWDMKRKNYHEWVIKEGIDKKLPPIAKGDEMIGKSEKHVLVGAGLHDSSAALIPYLSNLREPFLLLSTGTWCISLNPFNHSPLTKEELDQDCLCYLSPEGKPVKASRLFSGHEHEIQVKKLASFFMKPVYYFESVQFDEGLLDAPDHSKKHKKKVFPGKKLTQSEFATRELHKFRSYEAAYHQLMADILNEQEKSTRLVLNESVKSILVDGGFSENIVFMNLLARAFPGLKVQAASVAKGSALGAALVLHTKWNDRALGPDMVKLKHFPADRK